MEFVLIYTRDTNVCNYYFIGLFPIISQLIYHNYFITFCVDRSNSTTGNYRTVVG